MRTISIKEANIKMFYFLKELDPKGNNFVLVLPLKNKQAIMWLNLSWILDRPDFQVKTTDKFDLTAFENESVVSMPKLKETGLDIYDSID